jgi:hypothetical protein
MHQRDAPRAFTSEIYPWGEEARLWPTALFSNSVPIQLSLIMRYR